MKQIKLKVLGKPEQEDSIDYKELLKTIAELPNQEKDRNGRATPMYAKDVRENMRVLKALEESKDVLNLEDSDYNNLKKKVLKVPWAKSTKNVIQFLDDIENAEEKKEVLK